MTDHKTIQTALAAGIREALDSLQGQRLTPAVTRNAIDRAMAFLEGYAKKHDLNAQEHFKVTVTAGADDPSRLDIEVIPLTPAGTSFLQKAL